MSEIQDKLKAAFDTKATVKDVETLNTKTAQIEQNLSGYSATEIASTGLVDNTKYTLGEITALDLTSIPDSNTYGILIYFSTGESGCTLTYSANTNWLGSDAPSVEASKNYVILIVDGVCGINEYEPQTIA